MNSKSLSPTTFILRSLLLLFTLTSSFAASPYIIIDLGKGTGASSSAEGINNRSQVVGYTRGGDGYSTKAFIWQNGVMKELPSSAVQTWAYDVNDEGVVAGTSWNFPNQHGLVWKNGLLARDLGPNTQALDINASGEVAGIDNMNGAIWRVDGTETVISNVFLTTINRFSVAAGSGIWDDGLSISLPGTSATNPGFATGINDRDHVVGAVQRLPVLWKHGLMLSLPLPPEKIGTPRAINLAGTIVGEFGDANAPIPNPPQWIPATRAVAWRKGTMVDLNTLIPANSGWILNTASDINDYHVIVGAGTLNGELHGFLMRPR